MGTHPIFESDFDCLTECFVESFLKVDKSEFGFWCELSIDG